MRLAQPIETKREVWLRGVDLFPSRSLIPCNLLILRWSGMPRRATKACFSFSFHSVLNTVMNGNSGLRFNCQTAGHFLTTYKSLPPTGTQSSVEHAQCQKESHMSNGKDNQPNCIHIPRSRDSFTDQW